MSTLFSKFSKRTKIIFLSILGIIFLSLVVSFGLLKTGHFGILADVLGMQGDLTVYVKNNNTSVPNAKVDLFIFDNGMLINLKTGATSNWGSITFKDTPIAFLIPNTK